MLNIAPALCPSADSSVTHHRRKGTSALPCWIAEPGQKLGHKPPLVAIHGVRRGAKSQARLLGPLASANGQTVIAPLFAEDDFPAYQQVIRKGRADFALLSLLDDLAMTGLCRTDRFELCGYSGGAQFVHRFAMLYPHKVARLTIIASGWYTFPDLAAFPYGLATPRARASKWHSRTIQDLVPFLCLPINVVVGAEDTVVDANTRSGVEIDAQQGTTRRERAVRWVDALHTAAQGLGITPNITLTELAGCGHDFRSCLAHPETQDRLFSAA